MSSALSKEDIVSSKKSIIDRYGEWVGYNIHLSHGIYTKGADVSAGVQERRYLQVIADLLRKPFADLRILDLGCLEGGVAIECGMQGAEVIGIDGRDAHIAKARWTAEVLGLDRVQFIQDDVRNISLEKYGSFDVIFCLGLLYHLDAPSLLPFLHSIYGMTDSIAMFDTHVSLGPETSFEDGGKTYYGRIMSEHREGASDEEKLSSVWASLNNHESFWFTRTSLFNALCHAGFSSAYENHVPIIPAALYLDRCTALAVKGSTITLRSVPPACASCVCEGMPEVGSSCTEKLPPQPLYAYPPHR